MKPAQEEVVKASVTLYDGIIWALTSFFLFFFNGKSTGLRVRYLDSSIGGH